MFTRLFPWIVFTGVFAFVYYACFVFAYTPVRFYPLTGEITTADLPRSAGPAMGWYTWIVIGFVAGSIAGLLAWLVPRSAGEKVWPHLSWIFPAAVAIWMLWVEKHWFMTPPG